MTTAASWIGHGERGSPALVRLVLWLSRRYGRAAIRPLLIPITLYFFFGAPAARRASRDVLRRVLGRRPRAREVFHHFHTFASTILDRVFMLTGEDPGLTVTVSDPDRLLERARRGQGCMVVGAHLGSFEILRVLAVAHAPVRLKVLMRAEQNPMLTRVFAALNPAVAETLVTIRGPEDVLLLREWVQRGGFVGVLGDRAVSGERQVELPFLGSPAGFPLGPLELALLLHLPVYTAFGLHQGDGRYEVRFSLLVEQITEDRGERERALADAAGRYAQGLEQVVREHPFNWFNFFPFWDR